MVCVAVSGVWLRDRTAAWPPACVSSSALTGSRRHSTSWCKERVTKGSHANLVMKEEVFARGMDMEHVGI